MVPIVQTPPKLYSQNRGSSFGPFSYSFDRNIPFDGRNKSSRPIFIPVTIEGVINFGLTLISPLALTNHSADIIHVIHVATTLTTLVKNAQGMTTICVPIKN